MTGTILIFTLVNLIQLNIAIRALCEKYHVRSLFAFGSAIRNELRPDSDIDLAVDIESNDR
jgi:predicted nucleotidyltransferase